MSIFSRKQLKKIAPRRVFKNPFFHFGFLSFVLLAFLFFGSNSLAQLTTLKGSNTVFLNGQNTADAPENSDLFLSQNNLAGREAPDLKLSQDSFLYGVSTPNVTTTQTLGALLGGDTNQARTGVVDYLVEAGDTVSSVAAKYSLKPETVAWANGLGIGATLKTGQDLVILPVDGVIYSVKSGDTIADIAKKFKGNTDDIIAFNSLAGEGDIYEGDTVIIPGGVVPQAPKGGVVPAPLPKYTDQAPVAGFIYPLLKFKVTQGLHFTNAVDISSMGGCGSPVYAAAAGTILRAGYDRVGGNRVVIDHGNVKTYYGHLSAMLVKPGTIVTLGQQIGTEGETGDATGCHVHFQVMGAVNYIAAKFHVGDVVDVTKK